MKFKIELTNNHLNKICFLKAYFSLGGKEIIQMHTLKHYSKLMEYYSGLVRFSKFNYQKEFSRDIPVQRKNCNKVARSMIKIQQLKEYFNWFDQEEPTGPPNVCFFFKLKIKN